jgi:integrase
LLTAYNKSTQRGHLWYIIIIALETAGRLGELLRMLWSDVNFEKGVLMLQSYNGKKMTERKVGLTERATMVLEQWHRLTVDEDDRAEDYLNQFVFGGIKSVKTAFENACEDAKIDDLNFHDLRHMATTRMIQAGIPPVEVMKITGHTQRSTFERYVNIDEESARRIAEKGIDGRESPRQLVKQLVKQSRS